MLEVAQIIGETYEVVRYLGKGQFAEVYQLKIIKTGLPFAGKVMPLTSKVFQTEIDTLLRLNNRYLMHLYDYYVIDKSLLVLIIDYCPNGSLDDYVRKHSPLSVEQFQRVAFELLIAVQYLHENHISHKDIKPANILITESNHIMLSDFGLSVFDEARCTNFGGSLAYLSPEVVERKPHDPYASDMWAVGVTFFYLLTGKLPWTTYGRDDLKAAIMISIPDWFEIPNMVLERVLRNLLHFNPRERKSAKALLHDPFFRERKPTNANPTGLLRNPRTTGMLLATCSSFPISFRGNASKPIRPCYSKLLIPKLNVHTFQMIVSPRT